MTELLHGRAAAAGKSCGTCTLCCKVLRIEELDKVHGAWCVHAKPGRGCAIYADRPQSCRAFHCGWLASALPDEWFPAKSKIVLITEAGGGITAVVDSARPDAWREPPFHPQLKRWAQAGISSGRQVVVRVGKRTIAVLPDRDVDLGAMEPGERVLVESMTGPTGVTFNARRAPA